MNTFLMSSQASQKLRTSVAAIQTQRALLCDRRGPRLRQEPPARGKLISGPLLKSDIHALCASLLSSCIFVVFYSVAELGVLGSCLEVERAVLIRLVLSSWEAGSRYC